MDEKLKQVLGETRKYLDFRSVLSGFRPVGLVGLIEEHKEFNEYAGTNLPPYKEQLEYLQKFLSENNSNYELIPAWGHLYFIAEKSKKHDIEKLLKEHPRPIDSKEGEEKLGKLLSFPECCVKLHVNGNANDKVDKKEKDYEILPFAQCSEECSKKWIEEYLRLANEYDINPDEKFIK